MAASLEEATIQIRELTQKVAQVTRITAPEHTAAGDLCTNDIGRRIRVYGIPQRGSDPDNNYITAILEKIVATHETKLMVTLTDLSVFPTEYQPSDTASGTYEVQVDTPVTIY